MIQTLTKPYIIIYDQPESILPMPSFSQDFQLQLGDIFAWLSE
jgi:Uma2 family endonuclease